MRQTLIRLGVVVALAAAVPAAHAGIGDLFNSIFSKPATEKALAQGDAVAGIREALAKGTETAVNTLGRSDGFWGNPAARIPLPSAVERVGSTMSKVGLGSVVDEFHLTLNRAAEQAVPEVAGILGNAARQLTVADALEIVRGPDNAATQYFRRTAGEELFARIRPKVAEATQQVGVTQQYKALNDKAKPFMALTGGERPSDLDSYVTDKALDALFVQIAEQEQLIRNNPAERTSEILRDVFGQ